MHRGQLRRSGDIDADGDVAPLAYLTARAPGGIVNDDFSPNVNARSVPGAVAD
jgi:hypothetical protein